MHGQASGMRENCRSVFVSALAGVARVRARFLQNEYRWLLGGRSVAGGFVGGTKLGASATPRPVALQPLAGLSLEKEPARAKLRSSVPQRMLGVHPLIFLKF